MTVDQQQKCQKLHKEAMDLAEDGFFADRAKKYEEAKDFYKQAFQKEKEAALLLEGEHDMEPSRGTMFKSAGWLAINAGLLDDAEQMAKKGLEGKNLHAEIREELNEVLETVEEKRL